MPNSLLKQQRFPTNVTLVKINLGSIPGFVFVQKKREEEGQQSTHTTKAHSMLQNAKKMGEVVVPVLTD